jgi:hypothetical protein
LFFDTIIGLVLAFLTIGWAVIPALRASVAWRRATPNAVFGSMVIGGSYLEGTDAVPNSLRRTVATDSGVDAEEETMVEEADAALRRVQS